MPSVVWFDQASRNVASRRKPPERFPSLGFALVRHETSARGNWFVLRVRVRGVVAVGILKVGYFFVEKHIRISLYRKALEYFLNVLSMVRPVHQRCKNLMLLILVWLYLRRKQKRRWWVHPVLKRRETSGS